MRYDQGEDPPLPDESHAPFWRVAAFATADRDPERQRVFEAKVAERLRETKVEQNRSLSESPRS
jgi:hypothetical protein